MNKKHLRQNGFALSEVLVAVFVLAILSVAVFSTALLGIKTSVQSEYSTVAHGLAVDEIERINLMVYDDVGISGGTPSGEMKENEAVARNGQTYTVIRAITLVDDPVNGTLGTAVTSGTEDYKHVSITVVEPGGTATGFTVTTLVRRAAVQAIPVVLPPPVLHVPLEQPGASNALYGINTTAYPEVTEVVGAFNGEHFFSDISNKYTFPTQTLQQSGVSNYSLRFNNQLGSIDYIAGFSDNTFPLDDMAAYTISVWINPAQFLATQGILALPRRFSLSVTYPSSYVHFQTRSQTTCPTAPVMVSPNQASSYGPLPGPGWAHVAVVRRTYTGSNSTLTVYVNGVPGSSIEVLEITPQACSGSLVLGVTSIDDVFNGSLPPRDPFDGALDDLRVYDEALTQEQINELAGL